MATASNCPHCGGPLVPGALGNRCPRCLMGMGLSGAEEGTELPPAASAGIRQFGDYELLEEVGRGGMGVVYRARQISLNRTVAVKMLVARPFAVSELEERLHLEAEAAAGLNHPNIVTVYDFGECDDQFFFSMEYIEGRSLAQLTRHHSLAPTQAAQYVKVVAEAVHHAHEHGILHRDLKPSNILIDQNDQVKVTDFGLAKRLGTDSELTLTGQLVGSPNYLSPEQAAGKHQALTVRSDVYSLGAVLYQLLTARPPLVGESLEETLVQIREKEAPSPRLLSSGVPRDLETICLKCLQKEPARRYDSAQALAADLGRFLERKPISARPVSVAGRTWRWCRRKPALAGALAGCALALLIGFIGIAWQWQRAETEARTAQRNLYGADMLLAQEALEQSDVGRAKELLNRHRPVTKSEIRNPKSETDLCGWEWRYLWSQCQSDESSPPLFKGSNAVSALAFSADGSQLAVRRDPGVVMLWDFGSQRLISEHPASPWFKALAASPTNHLFAWGIRESNGAPSVLLWDARLQREVARLPHTNDVVSLAFSADAQWLATLTRTAEVSVWDVASQQVTAWFQTQTNCYIIDGSLHGCVVFSPTARLLAVGAQDRKRPHLQLLDWVSGSATVLSLSKPADGVLSMAFTPDGKWLALTGGPFDKAIHLYEVDTGAWSRLEGHEDKIAGLAFSRNGRLASGSVDQTLRLWDVQQTVELTQFQGHENSVWTVAWAPDGRRLVSGGVDGSVRIWDAEAKLLRSAPAILPERIAGLAFTPDSKSLLTVSGTERTVMVRDARTPKEATPLPFLGSNWGEIALAEDGRRLALGGRKGEVGLWDLGDYRQITNFVVGRRAIEQLQFSRTGERLLCVGKGDDRRLVLLLYDVASRGTVDIQGIRLEGFWGARLSPNGQMLLVGQGDGDVAWWDLETRQRQALFHWPHLGVGYQATFSPDGKWIAAGGGGKAALMLVNVATLETRQIARAYLKHFTGLSFAPDGRRLISGGTAGLDTVKVWDIESGRYVATLSGTPSFYGHIGFSPDGNTIFAVGSTGTALLWRAPSFEEIAAQEQAGQRTP